MKYRTLQRLYGVILLIFCAIVVALAYLGTTPEERDITPVLLLAPLGLYLIFTTQKVVCNF